MHRTLAGRAFVVAICTALLGPAVVLGQAPASPAAIDRASVAAASMLLTAADLPAGMSSEGITDGSAFTIDTADFATSGGLAIVEQTWSAQAEGPLLRVFDFRYLFPSPEAAQAFLDAAGPTLSEAAGGLSEVSGDIQIGDGYRHFAGEAVVSEQVVTLQNVFFRIGPVVAKVFVGGLGTAESDVLPIVKAAAGRIVNPTVGGPPTPSIPATTAQPTMLPTPQATAEPTFAPTAGATAGATAQPSPETADATPGATTEPNPGASPSGAGPSGAIHQWALTASASTEYGSGTQWSAMSATGEPNVTDYGDSQLAWTPKLKDGSTEWLDLRFDHAVIPTGIGIHESFSPGFVTRVEAYHTADGTWVTLWEGTDPTPTGAIGIFSPRLTATDFATDRIRVTIDSSVPDYNEVDAVELAGTPPTH